MELHLDTTEAETLRDIVESAWRDLRYEIVDTDNARFKAGLRDRERILAAILQRLGTAVPTT